jgi:hypothetical protein
MGGLSTIASVKITIGTYAGNDGVNRAIPHGLGVIPDLIFTCVDNLTVMNMQQGGVMGTMLVSSGGRLDVTTPDATNFYVGNGASLTNSNNAAGVNYRWMAFKK